MHPNKKHDQDDPKPIVLQKFHERPRRTRIDRDVKCLSDNSGNGMAERTSGTGRGRLKEKTPGVLDSNDRKQEMTWYADWKVQGTEPLNESSQPDRVYIAKPPLFRGKNRLRYDLSMWRFHLRSKNLYRGPDVIVRNKAMDRGHRTGGAR
jgi:hypothetical protein